MSRATKCSKKPKKDSKLNPAYQTDYTPSLRSIHPADTKHKSVSLTSHTNRMEGQNYVIISDTEKHFSKLSKALCTAVSTQSLSTQLGNAGREKATAKRHV